MRRVLGLLLLVLSACGGADQPPSLSEPAYHRDEAGALFGAFPPGALEESLVALGLPEPAPPLSDLEGGSCEAFVEALRALRAQPTGAGYGSLGQFFHLWERPVLARACYEAAGARGDEDPRWIHYQGDLAAALGREEEARALFEEAARRAPREAAPRVRLLVAARDVEGDGAIRAQARALLEVDPDSLLGLTELAVLELEDGDLGAAEELLGRARNAWPNQRRVHLLRARLERLRGRIELAERAEAQAQASSELGLLTLDAWMARLQAETSSLLYWKTLADELQGRGRWQELVSVAEELDRRIGGPTWKARAAQALLRGGDPRRARTLADELVRDHPTAAVGYEVIALVELAARQYGAALEASRLAIQWDPESGLGHEVMVQCDLALGREDRALVLAERLAALQPGRLEPQLLLSLVHRELAVEAREAGRAARATRHVEAANEALKRAEAQSPGDPRVLRSRTALGASLSPEAPSNGDAR